MKRILLMSIFAFVSMYSYGTDYILINAGTDIATLNNWGDKLDTTNHPTVFTNTGDTWDLDGKSAIMNGGLDLHGTFLNSGGTNSLLTFAGGLVLRGDVQNGDDMTCSCTNVNYYFTTNSVDIIPGTYSSALALQAGVSGVAKGNITVSLDLELRENVELDMATYTLDVFRSNLVNGITNSVIKTQNTSATPIALSAGVWDSKIEFNGHNQSIPAGIYGAGLLSSGTGTKTAVGNITVYDSLVITEVMDMGAFTLSDGPSGHEFTTYGTAGLKTQSTNNPPLPTGKTWSNTVIFNASSGGPQYIPSGTYNILGDASNVASVTHEALGDITINSQWIDLGTSIDMKTFAILTDGDGFSSTSIGTFTIYTQNTSSNPFPDGHTWGTGATVSFNATANQTIPAGTYYNLQCESANSGGPYAKTTGGAITVNNGLVLLGSATFLLPHHVITDGSNFGTAGSGTYGYLEIDGSSPAGAFPPGKTWYNHVFINQASYSIPELTMVDNNLYVNVDASLGGNLTLSGSGDVFVGNNSNARTLSCGTNTIAFNGTGCRVESTIAGCEVNTTATTPFSGTATIEFTDGVVVDFASSSAQNVPGGTYRGGITISNGTSYSNRKTATGALSMGNVLTIETDNHFHAGSNAISEYDDVNLPLTVSGDGYFYTNHLGGDPVPADIDWSSLTQFRYDNNAERVMGGTYSRLTLTGTGNNHITQGNVTCTDFFTINEDLEVAPGTYITGTTLDRSSNGAGEVILQASASGYGQARFTAKSGTQVMRKQYYLDVSSARWYHMGTTFPGADFQDLNDGNILVSASNNTGTVWKWNSDIADWEAGDLTSNDPAAGQTVYAGTTANGTFLLGSSGTVDLTASDVNVADQTIALNYDDGSSSSATFPAGDKTGWNFVANPFTGNYDWDDADGSLPANMTTAYYVWNGTNYLMRNGGSGTAGQYISPGQGFFVQTEAAWTDGTNMTFAISSVDVTGSGTFNKTQSQKDEVLVTFAEHSGNYQDELIVKFEGTSTPQFDSHWDAHKLINGPGVPNAWVKLNSTELSLSTTPVTTTDFPIAFKDDDANQMITATLNDDDLTSFNKAVLEDLKTGMFTELTNGGSYTFANDVNFGDDRFILHFSESTISIEENNETATQFEAFVANQTLTIINHSDSNAPLKGHLVDLSGRVIHSFVEDSREFIEIPLPKLTPGVYLLSINQDGNQLGAQKLIAH